MSASPDKEVPVIIGISSQIKRRLQKKEPEENVEVSPAMSPTGLSASIVKTSCFRRSEINVTRVVPENK